MMKFGSLSVSAHNFGFFRLDGGAMFGSVPKNLWAKRIPADAENCIRLATRCLVVRDEAARRVFLIDVGMGEKWSEKQRQIFAIDNLPARDVGVDPQEITDVVLTHLHFDHAGGISRYRQGTESLELVYPRARITLQHENLENAKAPSVKERASYLAENYAPLDQAELVLVEGDVEIHPGIVVHQVNGHSRGQQWIEIRGGGNALFYPTDLIPTHHHLPVPFHMGYDACAETVLKEKQQFLERARLERAVVVFEHDADLAACTVKLDERGHYAVDERVAL
jgi:glyoxylase-like metal-dependent hydrolase (beta-lactamase superfamily II)